MGDLKRIAKQQGWRRTKAGDWFDELGRRRVHPMDNWPSWSGCRAAQAADHRVAIPGCFESEDHALAYALEVSVWAL